MASIEASSRGMPPTRPAEVRPVSSTIRIRRSRSGRQVRTITSPRRAAARQSIDRTSSPMTYSRSESNSVPGPRSSERCCPSSWRSWAIFSPRCRRLRNGGSTRTLHATPRRRCRAASPSGPNERTMTAADALSPRRSGVSLLVTVAWPPAGTRQRGPPRHGVRARRPGGAHLRPQRPRAGIVHGDRGRGRLAQQHPGVPGPGDPQPPDAGRQHQVGDDPGQQQPLTASEGGPVPERQHDERAEQRRHRGPAGQRHRGSPRSGDSPGTGDHRGTGIPPGTGHHRGPGIPRGAAHRGTGTEARTASSTPSAVAPSISASGRSWIRCRNVGRASAFTSSGVT